ncbi:MAG TPA: ParB/RepB/Spo0J family partition protein [Geminicoccaceae bacterium]|nr:ParB/RepB/Spo0J family partition protein [Geminicoccaceae bacterium]
MTEVGRDGGGAARRRGLGMGLSALLGTSQDELPTVGSERSRLVPIEFLRPCPLQPRRRFGDDELMALADSIRHRGVMQPLLVRRAPSGADHYEIIAGERRWRAAQMAGAHELPVIVHELSDRDALEVALLENVQRQDLSALEEAEGYRRLIEEFGHTQEALAGALGKSRSHIANLLRLLGLPPAVRTLLENGELSAGHARALLGAREPVGLAKVVVGRGLNVRQTEALVRADAERPERRRQGSPAKDPNTLALERDLSTRLGLPVSLTPRGTGGTLQIAYGSLDQLDGLLRRLG